MSATVLIADDHPFVRRGLHSLLDGEPGLHVIGEAEDGQQVLQMAEKMRPHVLVVDLMMPKLNGLDVMRTLRRRLPHTRMIVLSMQSADPYVIAAFQAGAAGYVLKDSAPAEVVKAIRQALRGSKYLSPKLPARLAETAVENAEDAALDPYETLTEREREVFQLAAEGKTASEIAGVLCISRRTAELHRGRVMDKLGARNQTELVRFAVRRGRLPIDS